MKYYMKYLDFLLGKVSGHIRWGYVIFFVTYRCNAKCKHCFYWQNLNKKDDLTLEEIDAISKKLGAVQVLLLSGGEPLLRNDIVEIISLFIRQNSTKVVSIPTNALMPAQTARIAEKLANTYPEITFSINPSIDQLFDKNDAIRGIKGAFERSIETLRRIEKLRLTHDNIELVVNTTVSQSNYRDLDKIIDYFKQFDLTYHNFELLRGSPKEQNLTLPSLEEIRKVHAKALKTRDYYIDRSRSGFLEKMSVLGIINYTQSLKEKALGSGHFPFVCSAGKNIIVIEPNGDVKLCELLPPVGNLKDYEYNIEQLLRNDTSMQMWKKIKTCTCTHVCFINMSIAHDKKTLLKVPYYFLKWKSQRSA
jgi:MoaA/NifB/PqqE/SkfB family radical SAM enzyme